MRNKRLPAIWLVILGLAVVSVLMLAACGGTDGPSTDIVDADTAFQDGGADLAAVSILMGHGTKYQTANTYYDYQKAYMGV
mgnify:CR=1 FL=1